MSTSTSSAPSQKSEFGHIKRSCLFLEQTNTPINARNARNVMNFIFGFLQSFSPLYFVQGFSMPPYSTCSMLTNTVTSSTDLRYLLQGPHINGLGSQGVLECLGYLYDLCWFLEEKVQDSHQKTDELDQFLIEIDDHEPGQSDVINLDEDLYIAAGFTPYTTNPMDQQFAQSLWRTTIPNILVIRFDNPNEIDMESGGFWDSRTHLGVHSNGMSYSTMCRKLIKFIDIVFIFPNQFRDTQSQSIFSFINENCKLQAIDDQYCIAYTIMHHYIDEAIIPNIIQKIKQNATKSGQGDHRMVWDGQLKYKDRKVLAAAYCSKSTSIKSDSWPKEIELSNEFWKWQVSPEKFRHEAQSNLHALCQWMIKGDTTPFEELFHFLYDEDALVVSPQSNGTYILFTPKGVFTKFVQGNKDTARKFQFVSFLINKQKYEELTLLQRKSHNMYIQ